MKSLLTVLMLLGVSFAADVPKVPVNPDAPVLTSDQKNKLFELERQYTALAEQGKALGEKLQGLTKTYGELSKEFCKSDKGNFVLSMGDPTKGEEPACVEAPVAKTPTK